MWVRGISDPGDLGVAWPQGCNDPRSEFVTFGLGVLGLTGLLLMDAWHKEQPDRIDCRCCEILSMEPSNDQA